MSSIFGELLLNGKLGEKDNVPTDIRVIPSAFIEFLEEERERQRNMDGEQLGNPNLDPLPLEK